MSNALDKLQHELEATQFALAAAEARYAGKEAEHLSALKKSEKSRREIEQAHREWMNALDVLKDPFFVHDRDFRILRCNKAYQRSAGIPFEQIIGQPYYEVFPKTHAPLPKCLLAMKDPEKDQEENVIIGGITYRSRAYSIKDAQGSYLYSVHTLEDINERLLINGALRESEQQYRRLFEAARDGILMLDAETGKIIDANPFILDLLSYSLSECTAKTLWEIGLFKDVEASKAAFQKLQAKGYIRYDDLPLETKDGRRRQVEFVSNVYEIGDRKVIQCNIRDITDRKADENTLKIFRTLLDNSSDAIEVIDPATLRFLDVNETECHELGYSREELLSMCVFDIDSASIENHSKFVAKQIQSEGHARFDSEHRRRDGSTYPVEVSMTLVEIDKPYLLSIARDITERKRTERVLQNEKAFSETLIQSLPDIFFVLDLQGCMLRWNKQFEVLFGLSPEELLGTNAVSFIHEEDRLRTAQAIQQVFETGSASVESRLVMSEGVRDYILTGTRVATQLGVNLIGIGVDITARKRAETMLRESEEKFRAIFDHTSDGIIVMDVETHTVKFSNAGMEQMLGYGPGEMTGLSMALLHPPEAFAQVGEQFARDARGARSMVKDMPMLTKDGGVLYADLNGSPVDIGGHRYLLGAFRDATERRAGEMRLRRSNRALQTLSAVNLALVQAENENGLLRSITHVIADQGGYSLAVVDYAEDDPEKSITPMAWSGFEGSHYWAEHLTWADTERGQLPVARAIRSGTTQFCHDVPTDPSFDPWREAVQAHGYQANIAFPFRDDGKIFGSLSIYSSDANSFDEEEIKLLEKMADDLAYGIVALRTRKAQEQHAFALRQSLEQSIQTIADTVQARDPYTAGHQRRVSELAVAIAREMGLPEDQIDGIHFAGIIHDLGKIRVPSEILSNPGKLTPIEFELVKQHPRFGYDIIKNVHFPWPIADIVLQHHERMDGSGYPQGLKGDAILLEARIMAVADVVEAMSSHRPYRAGLGIEAALEEISKMRGKYYDPQVVDACLLLFREKNYVIPD